MRSIAAGLGVIFDVLATIQLLALFRGVYGSNNVPRAQIYISCLQASAIVRQPSKQQTTEV